MMRGSRIISVLWVVCCAMLAGCGMPSPAPTATPTPAETLQVPDTAATSPFWTLNLTTTATPDGASIATVTDAPTLDASPAPTATVTPGGASIVSFTATPAEAAPGDTITLRWQTTGGFGAEIVKLLPNQTNGARYTALPASGETRVTLDQGDSNKVTFVLSLDTGGDPLGAMAEVKVLCQTTWFFSGGPAGTCPMWAAGQNAGQGAAQQFEHGQIIFSGGDGWAVVLFGDGAKPGWTRLYPDWKPGQPENDPALTPPGGLFQPVRQIGAIWRTDDSPGHPPRERLGWATAPEVALATNFQCDSVAYYPIPRMAPCFVTGPDGEVIRLWSDPADNQLVWDALPTK